MRVARETVTPNPVDDLPIGLPDTWGRHWSSRTSNLVANASPAILRRLTFDAYLSY